MGALAEIFAPSPKAKLLEALFRLGSTEVTRGELAQEAGLFRTTTNRTLPDLVRLGLVSERSTDGDITVRANFEAPAVRILAQLAAALDYATGAPPDEPSSVALVPEAVDKARKALFATPSLAPAFVQRLEHRLMISGPRYEPGAINSLSNDWLLTPNAGDSITPASPGGQSPPPRRYITTGASGGSELAEYTYPAAPARA